MVRVQFEGSPDEVLSEIRVFIQGGVPVTVEEKAPVAKRTSKDTADKVAKTASEPAKPATKPATTEPSAEAEAGAKAISELLPQLVNSIGKPKTVEILAKFGVKKAGELKPEQYSAFLAEGTKVLADAASASL